MIDVSGLNKAAVLAALWQEAKPPHPTSIAAEIYTQPMTIERAQAVLDSRLAVMTVDGRRVDVDLSGDAFDEFFYDRANGKGAAAKAVESVRQAQEAMGD